MKTKSVLLVLVLSLTFLRLDGVAEDEAGFEPLFDGESFAGWVGDTDGYEVEGGRLVSLTGRGKGGKLLTERQFGDFVFRFDFKLSPGANNGLALRCPLEGKPHGAGFECQILDNTSKKYEKIKDSQFHGSIYKLIAAKRGFLAPVGEWNEQEVRMEGDSIRVTLNGEVILEDNDLGRFRRPAKGHLGFLGHGSRVEFRNVRIKDLDGDQ